MKKLITILFLLVGFIAKAQVEVQRSPGSLQVDDGRLRAWYNLIPPHYADTTAANLQKGLDYIGALIYCYNPGGMLYRDTSAGTHKWVAFPTGGAVSSVFGRTGNVLALTGDYSAFYPQLATVYTDPSWIGSLAASKISGAQSVTAGSSKISLSGTPGGSVLQAFSIDVNQANLSLSLIGGQLNVSQINATGTADASHVLSGAGTWIPSGGGGTGLPNSNLGTGYRWAYPLTNDIRTFFGRGYVVIDSTTNANGLTIFPDTAVGKLSTDTKLATGLSAYLPLVRVQGTTARIMYYGANGVLSSSRFIFDSTNSRLNLNAWSVFSTDGTTLATLGPTGLSLTHASCGNCNVTLSSVSGAHFNTGVFSTDLTGDVNTFGYGAGAPGMAGRAKVYIYKNAGSGDPGTGQLKLGDGVLVTVPESGLVEYKSGYLMFTDSIAGTNTRDTVAGRAWARANITGGGGVATIPPNLGAGYRIYAPQTPGFKTLIPTTNAGILIDSTTTTLNLRVDSSIYTTNYKFDNSADSFAIRNVGAGPGFQRILFTSAGTLVSSNLVPVYGLQFSLAADSGLLMNVDTTSATGIASKAYVNARVGGGGSGTPGGSSGDFQINGVGAFVGAGPTWDFTNKVMTINFSQNNEEGYLVSNSNSGANGAGIVGATNGTQTTKIVQHGSGNAYSIIPASVGGLYSNGVALSIFDDHINGRLWLGAGANISTPQITITPLKVKITPAVLQTGSVSDSFIVRNTADSSLYAISIADAVNGTSIAIDAVQTYTTGSTLTVTNGNNYVFVNPATVQAALTLTLPTTWHNSKTIYIVFGGTITSGNPVITSFSTVAGSGQTKVEVVSPTGTFNAGDVIEYKLSGTSDYRIL